MKQHSAVYCLDQVRLVAPGLKQGSITLLPPRFVTSSSPRWYRLTATGAVVFGVERDVTHRYSLMLIVNTTSSVQ